MVSAMSFWRRGSGRAILTVAGVFYLYLALLDQTVYRLMTGILPSDPALMAVGTFVSALLPATFAFAAIKQAFFPGAHTLARYEMATRSSWFWYLGGLVGIVIGLWPAYLSGTVTDAIVVVSVVLGLALVLYGRSIRRRSVSWTSPM